MAITQLLKHLIEAERAIARRKPIPTSGTIPTTGRLTGQRRQDPSNVITGELEEIEELRRLLMGGDISN